MDEKSQSRLRLGLRSGVILSSTSKTEFLRRQMSLPFTRASGVETAGFVDKKLGFHTARSIEQSAARLDERAGEVLPEPIEHAVAQDGKILEAMTFTDA